jgi:hypothetical protein
VDSGSAAGRWLDLNDDATARRPKPLSSAIHSTLPGTDQS